MLILTVAVKYLHVHPRPHHTTVEVKMEMLIPL